MRGKSNVIKRNVEKVLCAHYTLGARYLPKNTVQRQISELGSIHTMCPVSVPPPFHLRSVCVHTVRRVQSRSRAAHDRKPAIFPSNMQLNSFSKRQLAAVAFMLDEGEKIAAQSNKKKRLWVHECFRSSKLECE
jgi:hypothetical protein